MRGKGEGEVIGNLEKLQKLRVATTACSNRVCVDCLGAVG